MTMITVTRLLENPLAQRLARVHLHFLWQGLVAAIVAYALLAVLRRTSANKRYVSLVLLLVALAACPVATFALISDGLDRRAEATVAKRLNSSPLTVQIVAAQADDVARRITANSTAAARGVSDQALLAEVAQPADLAAQHRASSSRWHPPQPWSDARRWMEGHLAPVVGCWLIGVCLLSMRLLVGWFAVERLKRVGVRPVDVDLRARLDQLAGRLRITQPVRFLESALAEVPAVIGCLKPIVLLPLQACTGLPAEQLEAILAHELAHIKRWDYAINCLQVMVETLLFYHPVVWWLSRSIRREREHCCDDLAVSMCGDRFVYARALAAMESLRGRAPHLAMAAGSRGSPLRRRILRLLGDPHEPAPVLARWLVAAAALGAVMTLGGRFPWSATAADAPPSAPLAALSRDQIPAYELKVAAAVDPADASPSLVAILGDSRLKMMGYVNSMVFTADGRSLIGAANHEIAFWDPVTGRQERVLRGHLDLVSRLAISRDGQTLVSGDYDHLVKVWDVAAGNERFTLDGHGTHVSAVAISPDAKFVASADSRVRLWDLSGGRQHVQMKLLDEHGRSVNALAFGPDGQTLVSGGDDGTIDVWEVSTGRQIKSLSVDPVRERWRDLAFTPDGTMLAAAGFDHADWSSGKRRHGRFDTEFAGRRHQLGRLAAAGVHAGAAANWLCRWVSRHGSSTWPPVTEVHVPQQPIGINAVAMSPDGTTLATTGLMIQALGRLRGPGRRRQSWQVTAAPSSRVAFSPDEETSWLPAAPDHAVKLWGPRDSSRAG